MCRASDQTLRVEANHCAKCSGGTTWTLKCISANPFPLKFSRHTAILAENSQPVD